MRPGGPAENKIVSARRRNQHARRVRSPELATASRTHTSTVPDRARLLSASPEDRRRHLIAALQKLSNPNRTSVQHQLLVASVTTSSAAPEKQIFRRQGAPDRSRNFVGETVGRCTKPREFRASLATESRPTALTHRTQASATTPIIVRAIWLGSPLRPALCRPRRIEK